MNSNRILLFLNPKSGPSPQRGPTIKEEFELIKSIDSSEGIFLYLIDLLNLVEIASTISVIPKSSRRRLQLFRSSNRKWTENELPCILKNHLF